MIKYKIFNNELDIEVLINGITLNKNNLEELDDRIKGIYKLIENTIKYAIEEKLEIQNTILYIWISDRIPWYSDYDYNFPIYVFAKPKNSNYLLIPENTYECMNISKKFEGKCNNWNEVKEIINKKCSSGKYIDKINKIFFYGTSTTKNNSKIRENLLNYSEIKNNNWLYIKLNAWNNFISMDNFCVYKYLLNLPGHYPWSNRLKYLFLMKSIVINVDMYTFSLDDKYVDYPWISLINYIVKPNKHYINIKLNYYYSKDNKDEMNRLNNDIFLKFINKLQKIYNYDKLQILDKMVDRGYKRVNRLTNEHIYKYIYNCIVQNSKLNFI